jgi:hypothetical protein
MRFDDTIVERMQAIAWWRFNLLDLDIDLTDPARALDAIEAAVAEGLQPYAPEPIKLYDEYKRYLR